MPLDSKVQGNKPQFEKVNPDLETLQSKLARAVVVVEGGVLLSITLWLSARMCLK